MVYVKEEDLDVDEWRLKILQSYGGKTHVQCSCNSFPLIPSRKEKGQKKTCMKCHRLEAMQCLDNSCSVRLCGKCYKGLPTNNVTTLSPVASADGTTNTAAGESHFRII
jgi:hypothetical protein